MYTLSGRVAVVTGAGCGIGRAISIKLATEGCILALIDRDEKRVSSVAGEIRKAGGNCASFAADVSNSDSVERTVRDCVRALGDVDILVNNAGILRMGRIVDQPLAEWDETFAVNVGGVVRCTKAVLPRMLERRRGAVINIASWFGKVGKPNFAAYCASKFAVIGFTQSAALEVAEFGVRINSVCPGTIAETGMRADADAGARKLGQETAEERQHLIPIGRAGRPDDIAKVVAFLASDEAGYMTGQSINVTGGLWLS